MSKHGNHVPLEERFWTKVIVLGPDDCWEWTAAKNDNGYGRIAVDRVSTSAPRVSLEWALGRSLDPGMEPHHTCHHPGCVNPDHLEEVTSDFNKRERFSEICSKGHQRERRENGKWWCRQCNTERMMARQMAKRIDPDDEE